MISNSKLLIELIISFLPFVLFAIVNSKANAGKEIRYRQYVMPIVAVVYSTVMLIFLERLSSSFADWFAGLADLFDRLQLPSVGVYIRRIYAERLVYLALVLFNTFALAAYILVKKAIISIFARVEVRRNTWIGSLVEVFYAYDEQDRRWYIKEHYGQARTFIKAMYCGCCAAAALAVMISCVLCALKLVSAPFYPVFAVIIMGELTFFIDGLRKEEYNAEFTMAADRARHIVMYPLLRKPLRQLFGDKLAAEGTTVNNNVTLGGSVEDILVGLEKDGGHIGRNYAAFIRSQMVSGLKPDVDYLRCGYDLAVGKSLLLNTPFYDKLNPYAFYAMNRALLMGGKALVVLGRHNTEDDLYKWCEMGMQRISNISGMWKIAVLSKKKENGEVEPDIGIISRSGVHNLEIHKSNLEFLKDVSFVVIVEPSRLVTTAQIGLNLLIRACGGDHTITFCSVDRNCDGLVDALSHILMTNIVEVAATEYPHGMSSYMYWKADQDYLQHRILPGVSRYLGIGTELSAIALKNRVKETIWYGGDTFPVLDVHWIAKQYYYDLLDYARLPANQEMFDKCFKASFNMCNEKVNDYSFITVEDDRNNLFETRRNFATIAGEQGFVNVISSEYMLREYMADNTELFIADAKAIPYITADYARTRRNAILSLCLQLCIGSVKEEYLHRQMMLLNVDTKDPLSDIWKEICLIFGSAAQVEQDSGMDSVLTIKAKGSRNISFCKDETIRFKRVYSIDSGKFESVYAIENEDFARVILDDLQNASYVAEQENKDVYIGTELKGHVYQKYLPGQFFTLNGKYYEMISTATDNRILVRRASDHITGRQSYRQLRNYTIHHLEDFKSMGALKSVNNIGIHYQYADFSVETPGYWKMSSYNDFDNGALVKVNGVPVREYYHKQILKFDFTEVGDAFTDTVRITLTNLLNEVFVTLFAENQPFISAITPGVHMPPMTYSLEIEDSTEELNKCIYIIEDSQLDIGLLVAVERNINRIFQIISDYLNWNDEQIEKSIYELEDSEKEKSAEAFDVYAERENAQVKKMTLWGKIKAWFGKRFTKKNKPAEERPVKHEEEEKKPEDQPEDAAEDIVKESADAALPMFEATEENVAEVKKSEGESEQSVDADTAQSDAEESRETAVDDDEMTEDSETADEDKKKQTVEAASEDMQLQNEGEVCTGDGK